VRDRLIRALLFVVVSSTYYATASGLTSSNDGSHYALLRAMVDEGRFRIETYTHFAEGNDLAIRDGAIYSDRPPGTALLAVPFYIAGGVLPRLIRELPTRHDEGNPRLAYLVMLPVLAGAATAAILYSLLRGYDLPPMAALTAAVAFAFGSTMWKYGSVLFSHAPSAVLVIGGVALAIHVGRAGQLRPLTGLLLGLALGFSVVVEYSNALFAGLVLAYVAWSLLWVKEDKPVADAGWGGIALLVAGMGLPVAFLLFYNTVNFGGPLTTSYQYAINYPWAASFGTTFDVPWRQGLPGMLWYGVDARGEENQGLFLLMPVMLIGLFGVWAYAKRWGREAVLVLGLFGVYLLLFARHHTFSGFTADGRYLAPFLALWFVPVGFTLAELHSIKDSAGKAVLMLIAYGLLFLSVRNMLAHIAFSYNYHLDPGLVARRAATPANWRYILGNIFVNWQNLPLLWFVEGGITVILLAGRALWHRAANHLNPALPPASGAE